MDGRSLIDSIEVTIASTKTLISEMESHVHNLEATHVLAVRQFEPERMCPEGTGCRYVGPRGVEIFNPCKLSTEEEN